jgi:hypothetical protein
MLTNDSIIGKLRWEIISGKSNSVKKYERFFTCQSNIYQIRLNDRALTTSTYSNSRNLLSMLPNHHQIHDDEQQMTSNYR